MARFQRIQVAQTIEAGGIMPIFYHPDLEICKKVLKACYDGGLRVMEFTNRGDFAHEVFGELNKYAAKELPDMILGVGSIVDAGTTALFMQLGANFIVSPILNAEMAKTCNRRKVLWSPGCGSLSEINYAEELGAEMVKIFPGAQVGGPGFIKAVKGPCPWTKIMPTGGVAADEASFKEWFDAGATCLGMGSKLITKSLVSEGKYDELTENVKNVLAMVKKTRG